MGLFQLVAESWDLQNSLIAEKWAKILIYSWKITENLKGTEFTAPPSRPCNAFDQL